ncbi:unnamed protein product, partial [Symbiodinium sp. KB8]
MRRGRYCPRPLGLQEPSRDRDRAPLSQSSPGARSHGGGEDMRTLYAMIRDVEESLNTAVDVANHSSSSEERIEAVASARAATEALRHMLAVTDGAEGRKALSDTLRRVNTVLQVSWGRSAGTMPVAAALGSASRRIQLLRCHPRSQTLERRGGKADRPPSGRKSSARRAQPELPVFHGSSRPAVEGDESPFQARAARSRVAGTITRARTGSAAGADMASLSGAESLGAGQRGDPGLAEAIGLRPADARSGAGGRSAGGRRRAGGGGASAVSPFRPDAVPSPHRDSGTAVTSSAARLSSAERGRSLGNAFTRWTKAVSRRARTTASAAGPASSLSEEAELVLARARGLSTEPAEQGEGADDDSDLAGRRSGGGGAVGGRVRSSPGGRQGA